MGRTYDDDMLRTLHKKYDVFKNLDKDIQQIFHTLKRVVKTNVDEKITGNCFKATASSG